MIILIDENLPPSLQDVFERLGFPSLSVCDMPQLRGRSDEAVFNYAVRHGAIVVTRDVKFISLGNVDLGALLGLILLRFPDEVSYKTMCEIVEKLLGALSEADLKQLVVVEPGGVRTHHWSRLL